IPLARGWYRQDDFPENAILYKQLGPRIFVHWLRSLAVRYVVLTDAPPDYSARGESRLLRGGRTSLVPVYRAPALTIYRVPNAQPIVDGGARVLRVGESSFVLQLPRRGNY